MSRLGKAFTLVEILIVVVILGILAAIVVPQFANAADQATRVATRDQLEKVRRAIAAYYVRNGGVYPDVTAGDGTWGGLIGTYMREPPVNAWVPASVGKVIVLGLGPDAGYQTTHGWIFDPATGNVWAGSYDGEDEPYPR